MRLTDFVFYSLAAMFGMGFLVTLWLAWQPLLLTARGVVWLYRLARPLPPRVLVARLEAARDANVAAVADLVAANGRLAEEIATFGRCPACKGDMETCTCGTPTKPLPRTVPSWAKDGAR